MKILKTFNFTAEAEKKWLFSKEKPSAGIELALPPMPQCCCGIRIEAEVSADGKTVFSARIIQGEKETVTAPVIIMPGKTSVLLDPCVLTDPLLPLELKICRNTEDPADDHQGAAEIAEVRITALQAPESSFVVANTPGYNSWPMCQCIGEKIVCTYSRGEKHNIYEPSRAVYARVSSDGGKSWEDETLVCNTPEHGDVTIGKGLDENGSMLLWVRHGGKAGFRHSLFRSADGKNFEHISQVRLPADVVQITDIFHIPGVGLTALYFGGTYQEAAVNFWGKLTSTDNGITWQDTLIEKNLPKAQWPTEPSAIYLGNGRILVIARTESRENSTQRSQFQITSQDYGKTWHKTFTNITDVNISTPSLIYDRENDTVSCYYFYRGRGILNRRRAAVKEIFDAPLNWPPPETVASGSCEVCEAGNVNAAVCGRDHILAYYSGTMPDTAVYIKKINM
ncbi:MAG: exo-alpha-sialidase [Lentisphaeria bacterium]|nr:exo-alpha-sialidase [Lentisphaeria bacterium]